MAANPYGLRPQLDVENKAVLMRVVDKANDEVVEEQSFPFTGIHDSLKGNVSLYGLSKLLSDRTSDTTTGPGKLAAMQGVFEQLAEGTWQKERKIGAPTVSAEVEALAQLKNITVAEAQAALRAYSKEARKNILSNPKIVELAAHIREARETAPDVDLSEFQTGEPEAASA